MFCPVGNELRDGSPLCGDIHPIGCSVQFGTGLMYLLSNLVSTTCFSILVGPRAASPLAMAFACSFPVCVTGSPLAWRSSSALPLAPHTRLLASSTSHMMVEHDVAMLRRTAGCQNARSFRPRRRRAQAPLAMAMESPPDIDTTSFVLGVLGTGAVSFGVFRAVVYFNVQYFIAALLGRHVPRGGARILDLGIREGRNLYYYPKDTVQVVAVTPKPNVQLLESQAVNAKVPIRIASDFSRIPPNSMDAVVSVYGMAEMSDEEVASALKDAVRVLKPGKPLIYVENVGSENVLVRAAQQVVENIGKLAGRNYRVTRDVLPIIQNTEGLEDLQYETILDFQDPHLCGIARKKAGNLPTKPEGIGKQKIPRVKKDSAPQKIEFPGQ